MSMVKTQVYFAKRDLERLHRVARAEKRPLAELIRDAVRARWLAPVPPHGPIALFDGELTGTSSDHDSAFDNPRD